MSRGKSRQIHLGAGIELSGRRILSLSVAETLGPNGLEAARLCQDDIYDNLRA